MRKKIEDLLFNLFGWVLVILLCAVSLTLPTALLIWSIKTILTLLGVLA